MSSIDINELIRQIDDRLITFYNNEIEPERNMPLYQYILSLNINFNDYIEDLSGSYRVAYKARFNTLKNWYKCAIRDLESASVNKSPMKYFIYLRDNSSFNLTWDEFKVEYTDKVNKWHDEGVLTEFPFLKVNSIKTRENAFYKEFILCVIVIFKNTIKEGLSLFEEQGYGKDVFLQPLDFFLGPFVSINSPGFLLQEQMQEGDNQTIVYNDYPVPYTMGADKTIIRSLISANEITDHETNIRTLTTFDVSLLLYIVNFISEVIYSTFLKTRSFQNYLVDIVKAMYPNTARLSASHYKHVRDSLVKLSTLNVKGIRNNEVVSVINFFDSFTLYAEDSGRQVATLGAGSYLYERIATRKTQLLFSHEVKLIEDKSAQFIFYLFEGERQTAYANGKIDKEQEYNYTYFLHSMVFPSRATVKANMDLIDNIFQLFIELDIVFASYIRKTKCFIVRFKPFSRDDIINLKLDFPTLLST